MWVLHGLDIRLPCVCVARIRGVQKLIVIEETDRHRSFRTVAATDRQYQCQQAEGEAISDASVVQTSE